MLIARGLQLQRLISLALLLSHSSPNGRRLCVCNAYMPRQLCYTKPAVVHAGNDGSTANFELAMLCHMNAKFCAPTAVICLMSSLNCVWAALGLQLLTEGPLISADGANRKHCSAIWCKHRESDRSTQISTVMAHLPDCLLAAESQLIHCRASATNKKTGNTVSSDAYTTA